MRPVTDLLIIAAPALMLAMLWCLWRAARLFFSWNPAAAHVRNSGYSELEQQDDYWHGDNRLATMRGWDWRDGEGSRSIEDEVTFDDADGNMRRAAIRRQVARGRRPDGIITIWYDPADPARATAFGPGSWALMALLCAGGLASLFALGMELAAKSGQA